ncbi:putative transcription antiterminator LicT [Pasteurella bettyae CCUG 2042]|uniref:Putative transcription antiterminator LicT n=2 Tax=Pasteurella bettyae TaxID=752 RepID=I3D6M7_9PAST|nr:PRD domain-containing protein [Pasteurella bettyae]EIJ67370.1 putative transcription antiterminator LicT [Pasteurella bettyae CCUG 2042]
MKIQKILNNSVALSFDENNNEIVVMGKGIAYGKQVGDSIDESLITKCFILNTVNYSQNIIHMLGNIPSIYIDITDMIMNYVQNHLNLKLHESTYLSLIDHIHASVERFKSGVVLKNKLLWEIKHFYKKEYEVGIYVLNLLEKQLNIKMLEDEAGFIALHIVSATKDNDINNAYKETAFIHSITNIVKYYFNIEYDYDSFDYNRFLMHLKFFSMRVFSEKVNSVQPLQNDLLNMLQEQYKNSYLCSLKIKEYIQEKYHYELDSDEILYLTIHIAKITHDKR